MRLQGGYLYDKGENDEQISFRFPQPIYKYILSYVFGKVNKMKENFQKEKFCYKYNIFCENRQFFQQEECKNFLLRLDKTAQKCYNIGTNWIRRICIYEKSENFSRIFVDGDLVSVLLGFLRRTGRLQGNGI